MNAKLILARCIIWGGHSLLILALAGVLVILLWIAWPFVLLMIGFILLCLAIAYAWEGMKWVWGWAYDVMRAAKRNHP